MKPPRSLTREYPHITSCVDAKKPIEVTVTIKDARNPDDIMSLSTCAMARAMCREWKADHAIIGLSYSYVLKGTKAIRFTTPASVQREIVSFDRGAGFKPGEYHLGPIPRSLRLDAPPRPNPRRKGTSGTKPKGSSHQPKRVAHRTSQVRSMQRNDWKTK